MFENFQQFWDFFSIQQKILNLGKNFLEKNILLLIFDKVLTPSRCVDLKKKRVCLAQVAYLMP